MTGNARRFPPPIACFYGRVRNPSLRGMPIRRVVVHDVSESHCRLSAHERLARLPIFNGFWGLAIAAALQMPLGQELSGFRAQN